MHVSVRSQQNGSIQQGLKKDLSNVCKTNWFPWASFYEGFAKIFYCFWQKCWTQK